jgi:hypothetical protein
MQSSSSGTIRSCVWIKRKKGRATRLILDLLLANRVYSVEGAGNVI